MNRSVGVIAKATSGAGLTNPALQYHRKDQQRKQRLRRSIHPIHHSHRLEVHSELDDEPEFKIGIPGYRAIFGKGTATIRRISWVSLTLACAILAVTQVQDRVNYYMRTPTRTSLVVATNATLIFPRVTLCHRNPLNLSTMEEIRPMAALALGVDTHAVKLPYDLLSVMNLSALWKLAGSDINTAQGAECWFGRGKPCNESGRWLMTPTAQGPCYTYAVDHGVKETGLFHGLYIQSIIKRGSRRKGSSRCREATSASPGVPMSNSDDAWAYFVHSANHNPALEFLTKEHYEHTGSNVDIRVTPLQKSELNVWHDPCVDDVNYTREQCELECLSQLLVARTGCLLPFMRLSQSLSMSWAPSERQVYDMCNTSDAYRQADEQLRRALIDRIAPWNSSECHCPAPCYSTAYATNVEKVLANGDTGRFRLRVYFQDKTYEMMTESKVYSLTALFCDIGSSIGLLLGASVLTVCEALEWSCFSLIRCLASSLTGCRSDKDRRVRPLGSNNVANECNDYKGGLHQQY